VTFRRISSGDKVVTSPALNILGVQVFRTLAARGPYNVRRVPVAQAVAGEVEELRREGIVVMPRRAGGRARSV
jgi:hypothetical protein